MFPKFDPVAYAERKAKESARDIADSIDDAEGGRFGGMTAAQWRKASAARAFDAAYSVYTADTPSSLDQWELNCYGYCAQIFALWTLKESAKPRH